MKLITGLILFYFAMETVHCSRSWNLWDYLKQKATLDLSSIDTEDDHGVVMPLQDRQKKFSFYYPYYYGYYDGSGSGEDPVIPDPEILPFKKCVPHYIANRTEGIALPSQCPPLPTPSSHCDCPPPNDVKTADDDVILDELNIEVQIYSQYVKVSVDAVVFNPHDGVQLADFNLRLPEQAFISYFHINVNDEILVADIEEKEKAKEKFNEAVKGGQTAATVEARGKNEFKTNVAVSRYCRMRFLLRYEYLVVMTAGKFSVPIHVTPSIPALTRRLKVYIYDKNPISCVKPEEDSGYDDVTFNMIHENEAELSTELTPKQTRDFVITYNVQVDNKVPGTTLVDENGYLFVSYTMLTSECRAFEDDNKTCEVGTVLDENSEPASNIAPKKPFKLCLLFIVDVSGSMSGEKIAQAKQSLLHIVEKLSDDDCIGIILFSSLVTRKTTGLIKVGNNREKLNKIIKNIYASGLTNFDGALQDGIKMMTNFVSNSDTDCVHLMVSLTDGEPTTGVTIPTQINDQFKESVKKFTRTTRKILYPYFLGFGSDRDLNFDLLEQLAAGNSGFARRIYKGSDVEQQLIEFFKEIACPVLCSMRLKFRKPGLLENITNTDFAGCSFGGSQLLAAARVKDTNKLAKASRVELKGSSSEGKKILSTNQFITRDGSNTSSLIERTWAYLQITQILEQVKQLSGEDRKQLENELLLLSLHYKFVTRLTSLVVVKPCENRTLGSLESIDDQGHTTQPTQPIITSSTGSPFSSYYLDPFSIIIPPPAPPSGPQGQRPSPGGQPGPPGPPGPPSPTHGRPRTYPTTRRPATTTVPTTHKPTGVTSDPHFLVETLSGDWLCYTLKGIEGEVYNLLSDVEYSVNGLLIGTVFKGSEQTYFGSISITYRSCETGLVTKFLITADNGLAVIGEGSLSWEDVGSFSTSDQKFVITMNHTLVQITSNEDTVQFAILRSQLNCTKYSVCPRKHYLGFYVPGITGLTSKTHGMIGQFLKQSTEVDGGQMEVRDRKLTVKPFERLNGLVGDYQKCWSTDDYGMKFLDGTADDYLVKDLFDSDFTYSHYHCN